jgi:hypothetical protein
MDQRVKAHLNLLAVLPNLEDLVGFDDEARRMAVDWKIRVLFSVRGGPSATLAFQDGRCRVSPGRQGMPNLVLGFTSPSHLNAMFDNQAKPIPLWGLHRLPWLAGQFPKLAARLEYYLRADDARLADPAVFDFVLGCQMRTAMRGLKFVAELDPEMHALAAHTAEGVAELRVLPDGPVVGIEHTGRTFTPLLNGNAPRPNVRAVFGSGRVAFDLLNGRGDAFAALGRRDVVMEGFLPLIDDVFAMLDHLGRYLK